MKHFIYKTTHVNGKYYIGRHSTDNIDDGYLCSGKWPRSIKNKTELSREILEFTPDLDTLKIKEAEYLAEHYGKPNCMNLTADPIGFDSDNNPMKNPAVSAKISGDNNWTRRNPDASNILRKIQLNLVEQGTHIFQGDSNPNKDGKNAKQAMISGKHNSITNNPSTINAENGTHHWQNGKSPNYQGKLNKKLIEQGTHNFLGPELNQKRVSQGTHNFLGAEANLKRLAEGTHPSQQKRTCEHCGKIASISMHKRWHGINCKTIK